MRGFTLIELVITFGILVTIATLLLADYPRFVARVNLTRDAQEIALNVRQAQAFALAVRGFDTGAGTVFEAWGVNFDISVSDKEYALFVDYNPANSDYDPPLELAQTFQIGAGTRIVDLCAEQKTSPPGTCNLQGLERLDITYRRPNPTTTLKGNRTEYQDLEIVIEGREGARKTIVVWRSGQVTIE